MQHLIEQLIIEITEMNHRFERVKSSEIDYDFTTSYNLTPNQSIANSMI